MHLSYNHFCCIIDLNIIAIPALVGSCGGTALICALIALCGSHLSKQKINSLNIALSPAQELDLLKQISVKPQYLPAYTLGMNGSSAGVREEMGFYQALAFHKDSLVLKDFVGKDFVEETQYPWEPRMAGMAFLAAYIQAKRDVEANSLIGLKVCHTLKVFQKTLEKISHLKKDMRMVLIVPTRRYILGHPEPQTLHKVAICIEKVKKSLKIVCLDGSPRYPCVDFELMSLSASALAERKKICQTQVPLWMIFNSQLDWGNIELYISEVNRLRMEGCAIFALRDAVAFLDNKNFFQTIKTKKRVIKTNKEELVEYSAITELPPQMMASSQFMEPLNSYLTDSPFANIPFAHWKGGKKQQDTTLVKSLQQHVALVNSKPQNHYISRRLHKYSLVLSQALHHFSDAQLKNIIATKLIQDDSPSSYIQGQPIKDFDDLLALRKLIRQKEDAKLAPAFD